MDGRSWHVCDTASNLLGWQSGKGSTDINVGLLAEQQWKEYEWFYKGETINQIEELLVKINSAGIPYNIGIRNCIDIAKGLFMYARGLVS